MEQQQQAMQNELPSPGSPRRRKPALDLDAALYLQSQASLVQEPSRSSPTSSKLGQPGQLASGARMSLQYSQNKQQPQQQVSLKHRLSVVERPTNVGDISVDYIDCVSNNDLSPAAGANFRTMSQCKKHLRFHRNRVEPSPGGQQTPGAGETVSSSCSSSPPARSTFQQTSAMPPDGQKVAEELVADMITPSLPATSRQRHRPQLGSLVMSDGCSSSLTDYESSMGGQPGPNASVLYPISVSEVKKRTYFIGSLGQDSLLGHEELYRYFPNGRVSIFVCTWNQNRKRTPSNLNDLLLPEQLVNMPDIYAIGIQEAFSSQTDYLRDWEVELQTTLGPNHVLLHSSSLGVLHLALFVRRDLIWFCSTPEESVYNSRSMPTNMIKTKGAVSIAFRFFGTSFMFTNCHFPAHENRLKDRIDEYQRIINSIDLPKNLKLLKPRYLSNDSTARFDCVFFIGDLNFRLEQRTFDETIHILEDIFQQTEPSFEALTQNDELLKVMETDQAFHGFDESAIRFPPTYKFLAQTNKYDRQTKRVPSYTDRILFRSKRQRHIQCLIYDWLPQLLSSDHKPVYCLFDVLVRPGHEQNMISSLNAGLFQRTVYLEALKRRSEDPESMRDNGAGGNLICSVS